MLLKRILAFRQITQRSDRFASFRAGPGALSILVLLLVVPWRPSMAEALSVDSKSDKIPLNSGIEYIEDSSGSLNFETIRSLSDERWQKTGKPIPSFGYQKNPFWFRVKLKNSEAQGQDRIIEVDYSRLDTLNVFRPESDGSGYTKATLGDNQPYTQREIDGRTFAYKVHLDPERTTVIYMQVRGELSTITLPITLYRAEAFHREQQLRMVGLGIFSGVVLVMVFYNLFIYFAVRDTSYAIYVFFVLSLFFTAIGLNGLGFQLLYPRWVWWQNHDVLILSPLTFAFAGAFSIRYLDLKLNAPVWYRIFQFLTGFFFFATVAGPLFLGPYYPQLNVKLNSIFALLAPIVFGICALILAFRRYRVAYFYLAAWPITLAASVAKGLQFNGLIPPYGIVEWSLEIATCAQSVLLALGLADRINAMKNRLSVLNESLEEEVADRTKNLEEALGEIENKNAALNDSLMQIQELKVQQDGDYFLTSLLLNPLSTNTVQDPSYSVDFAIQGKKQFEFRNKQHRIGGDTCIATEIRLRDGEYIAVANSDAMGKSLQGAGGALVFNTVFQSILKRTQAATFMQSYYPERWLKAAVQDLHQVFASFDGMMAVSVLLAVIHKASGQLYFINAEHPWPVLYRGGKATFLGEDEFIRKIGFESERSLRVLTERLRPGDTVFMGSDGRDDILLGVKEDGTRIINQDEYAFLRKIEECNGDWDTLIQKYLKDEENLTDDFSLARITCSGIPGSTLEAADQIQEIIRGAMMERNQENSSGALQHLRSYPEQRRAREILLLIGDTLCRLRRYKRAAPFLLRYLHLCPWEERVLARTARVLIAAGYHEKAIDIATRLVLRNPEDADSRVLLAECFRAGRKPDKAREILERVLEDSAQHERAQRLHRELAAH